MALLHLDERLIEHLEYWGEAGVHADQSFGLVDGDLQQAGDGGVVVLIEQIDAATALLHQLGAVGQALVLLFYFLKFAGLQGKLVEFLHLIFEQLATGLALLLLGLEASQLVLQLAPALIVFAHLAKEQGMTGVTVEQGKLIVGAQQQLVGVLAVHVNQQLAQALELGQRHGHAVDIAA